MAKHRAIPLGFMTVGEAEKEYRSYCPYIAIL
ncbi:hypothetical protein C824_000525 [Schaedlerella arabinosiphila]|nr:hypothetical protein C824_000525 [Schaedlerella arabinosiphila]